MNTQQLNHEQDFTTAQYAQLLHLANKNYKFIDYSEISFKEKFVLWRHDCDYSLNRSLRLAQIEMNEGVKATYFLNPHSQFYNPLEKSQAKIIKEIIGLGHKIGLHFDPAYYDIKSEDQLSDLIESEAAWLSDWFNTKPVAFSFHNPTEFSLNCERESYGGLLNCYAKIFKSKIPYCSDSNGYWRFRRLQDVLASAQDPCLQVLTHPGWWQEEVTSPRERIFRCVDGRAAAVMQAYDEELKASGRANVGVLYEEFQFLKKINRKNGTSIEQRWLRGEIVNVYIELWRLFESQVRKIIRIWFKKFLCASNLEINKVFESPILILPMHKVLAAIYRKDWFEISSVKEVEYLKWSQFRNNLVHGFDSYSKTEIQEGVGFILKLMTRITNFRQIFQNPDEEVNYDIKKSILSSSAQNPCILWILESHKALGISKKIIEAFIDKQNIARKINS